MNSNSAQNSSVNPGETRRAFIRKAATVAAAVSATSLFKTPAYGQTQAPSTGRVIGANDRIHVAYIGTGKPNTLHINLQKKYAQDNNIAQAAVCDVYQRHLDAARKATGVSEADAFIDYRKLLERKDIDAVVIAPTDPWHAQISIDSMEAGKHVFCEKPMARYLAEAFEVYDTVKKTGKTYVIGSQGCMDSKWHKAAEWIKANCKKPVAGFIAGATAPPGRRMGHAGAIVSGGKGTAEAKIAAFKAAGIGIAVTPSEMADTLLKMM